MKTFEETKKEFMNDFLLLLKKYDAEFDVNVGEFGYCAEVEVYLDSVWDKDHNIIIEGGSFLLNNSYSPHDYDNIPSN